MSTQPIPTVPQVKELFGMLLGDDAGVAAGRPMAMTVDSKQPNSTYIDDAGRLQAVLVCDMAFAAYSSSALTRIPVGGAQEALEEGTLSSMMMDNFNEVMNICVILVSGDTAPHVKLDKVNHDLGSVSEEVMTVISSPSERLDLDIDVPGYGKGQMSVLLS